jgi:hypothetical protein
LPLLWIYLYFNHFFSILILPILLKMASFER